MALLRRLAWVLGGLLVVQAVPACVSESDPGAELNPQPLPPEDPGQRQGDDEATGAGGSMNSPTPSADGSDASDGGAEGGSDSGADAGDG